MGLKNYDFKKISVVFGGRVMTGFAAGSDAISIERNEDMWKLEVGSDGEATRSKSNNRSGKVMIKLQSTSESNAILTGFIKADELSNAGIQPLLVKDNSGNSLYSAEQAWVTKTPKAGFGDEVSEREYTIETDSLLMVEGGN